MNNEQPPIESLDVLVHPFFGMRNPIPYDGEFLRTPYAKVGAFIQGQFPGDMPGHEYARLLEALWKERISTIAADPAHALLFVPYASSELLRGQKPTLLDEQTRSLALFAKEQLGTRCIFGLPHLEEEARHEVVQRCSPDATIPIHSYGEISYLCVLGETADLMTLLAVRGFQFEHHHRLDLCGDRIEGKREAYARLLTRQEARP
ncbi:MAG: hypothetical protein Q7R76_04630 [Candidatus Woesearchaeota archaeon]|nr:hypothetical protein [Candidatus Woesearchaeota archaeon]